MTSERVLIAKKVLDEAVEFMGYHPNSAIRVLNAEEIVSAVRINFGRPAKYNFGLLLP